MTSGFSESKPNATSRQEIVDYVASYAIKGIVESACEAVKEYVHVPVCKVVKFFSEITSFFWDEFQNTPSSQSGNLTASYNDLGLGGNINSVTVQLYDLYNFPAVTLFEYANCTVQSQSFGVRNFTVGGNSTVPNITEVIP